MVIQILEILTFNSKENYMKKLIMSVLAVSIVSTNAYALSKSRVTVCGGLLASLSIATLKSDEIKVGKDRSSTSTEEAKLVFAKINSLLTQVQTQKNVLDIQKLASLNKDIKDFSTNLDQADFVSYGILGLAMEKIAERTDAVLKSNKCPQF